MDDLVHLRSRNAFYSTCAKTDVTLVNLVADVTCGKCIDQLLPNRARHQDIQVWERTKRRAEGRARGAYERMQAGGGRIAETQATYG